MQTKQQRQPQHLCHAVDCNERVPPARLMCPRHWFMVPRPLRLAVWRTYKPGQEVTKTPSEAYLRAARVAVNSVAMQEGREPLNTTAEVVKTLESLIAQHKE